MHDLFGVPFNPTDFLHKSPDSEKRRVCTCKLDKYISRWQKRIVAASRPEKSKMFGTTSRLLEEAREHCGWFDRPSITVNDLPYTAVMLSIKVMLSSVLIAASGLPRGNSLLAVRRFYPMIPETKYPLPSGSILWEHMLMNGWCMHDLKRLFMENGYNIIYYLASLRRDLGQPRNHQQCHENGQCVANNMSDRFKPKHVDGCPGDCPDIGSPMEKVNTILNEGGIPVISYTEGHQKQLQLGVFKAGSSTMYTAITHGPTASETHRQTLCQGVKFNASHHRSAKPTR